MQFIANGPDIPEALLQAQEDGRVVYFCGAGISNPAGLPDFKGLVDSIYRRVGTTPTAIEQETYNQNQFDATLYLLERRLPGQRLALRKALSQALQPKWRRSGATDTHAALLQLARTREGALRLVTTNFDRIFERAAKRTNQTFQAYSAPMLPIPKNSRWNGLVYLHGQLPSKKDDSALHRLVLTSGDFGLAYLTERWAARFVSELFRNYVVCFVGYGINDPVLRYMMDALAADRMLGEITPVAYALGSCSPEQEQNKTVEWEAKGVTPILYEVPASSRDHSLLHKTLHAWAATYRDGVLGKERIVVEYALVRPSASTQQDDFVGRLLWALSHESGLPAKRFADLDPAPPLDWLEAFSEHRYFHGDLHRFGVVPGRGEDDKLNFSLIQRPAPYQLAPWMKLVTSGVDHSQWDDVMQNLARWLVRYLNDPALVIWLAQRGGQLHNRWSVLIESQLNRICRFELEGNATELEAIRASSPMAIPCSHMRILWRLLLTGRLKSWWPDFDLFQWKGRMVRDGLTASLRLELRKLLAPKVSLKKPYRWESDKVNQNEFSRIKQLVEWELVLSCDGVHSFVIDLGSESHWREALPSLLNDFQQLLCDSLDLLHELGEADNHRDKSHWYLPSISRHWQNRHFHDWVTLIELLRDSWLALLDKNSEHARRAAQAWIDIPYPTFKRLAFFAASHDKVISSDQWLEWLLTDEAWWLWSENSRRETIRLIVLQSVNLSGSSQSKLEAALLVGPPRRMYREGIEPEQWQVMADRSIWLRLTKLKLSVTQIGEAALMRLDALSAANPNWQLASNEQDEFSHWSSGTGDPDYQDNREIDIAPRKRKDLVDWLQQERPESYSFYENTWRETCRTRFFHSLLALRDLAKKGIWPPDSWQEALQAWSEDAVVYRSWCNAAPLVRRMSEEILQENIHAVTWWMEAASKKIDLYKDKDKEILFELCSRLLAIPLDADSGIRQNGEPINNPMNEALNHPVGNIALTLLNFWFKTKPSDNETLPEDIKLFFDQLCDVRVERFRHGRVWLASNLIPLFRTDRSWTETHLLPLFDWSRCANEAKAAWAGFLSSPRLYRPLLAAFKSQFLLTARHYAEMGGNKRNFAFFITYAALDRVESYTTEDFQTAIGILPKEGLEEVAQALLQALEGAGEQREDYWKNRIQRFWQTIWPKSRDLATNTLAESLARLCIASGSEFGSALEAVVDWLIPIEYPNYVVHCLHESRLCFDFPEPALRLLGALLADQPSVPMELDKCLESIASADKMLVNNTVFKRLHEYSRRRGT
ncbi:MAG: hypothetical protein ACI9SC_001639 [Gammaproteobacteria bacterium]|jgi:hypothetical protein